MYGIAYGQEEDGTNDRPPGGETTVSKSGMVRKTLWLHGDEAEALRLRAFKERRAESEIVREALRALLGIED